MTDWKARPLGELQQEFRAGSTNSMPIAGMAVWAALGVAALFVSDDLLATLALYIMAAILPLAFLLDRLRGRNLFAGGDDPLTKLFLLSIVGIAVTVPLVVEAANIADAPVLVVLGMAILAGVIWIPYGWAADDPVGLRQAIGRSIGAYLAYWLVEEPWTASAICAVVVASYGYTLAAAKPMGVPA